MDRFSSHGDESEHESEHVILDHFGQLVALWLWVRLLTVTETFHSIAHLDLC